VQVSGRRLTFQLSVALITGSDIFKAPKITTSTQIVVEVAVVWIYGRCRNSKCIPLKRSLG
jgi:hypothetical protein